MNRLCLFLAMGGLLAGSVCGNGEPTQGAGNVASVRRVLDTVRVQCLEANSPEELSALWAELSTLKKSLGISDADGTTQIAAELQSAILFVGKWRDYLRANSSENRKDAYEILAGLLSDQSWVGLIPRSAVLELYQKKSQYIPVEFSTATIEDLPGVVAAFERAELGSSDPGKMQRIADKYLALQTLWESRKDGDWDRMVTACRIRNDDHINIIRFKMMILSWVVAEYLDLDEKYRQPPAKGETAPQYLDSIITRSANDGDLITQWRAMTYLYELCWGGTEFREEMKAVDLCLTGRELEQTGQYERAVASYLAALKRTSVGAPILYATTRLIEIRRGYPDAFRIGSDSRLLSAVKKRHSKKPWSRNRPWTKY